MNNDGENNFLIKAGQLRQNAEEQRQGNVSELPLPTTLEETLKLFYELQVHQIELEMQNRELIQIRDDLDKSLKKYTDLFEFAPVGFFNLDPAGTITALNIAGAGLLGGVKSQLIGQRFGLFVADAERSNFNNFLSSVRASRVKESCELTVESNAHHAISVLIEAMTAASGQEVRLAMFDTTERRQAENSLRESEERMYKLAEMAVDAIVMMDEFGTVTYCNAAAERMFCCSPSEITGQDFHKLFTPERLADAQKLGVESFREQGTGPLIGRWTELVGLRKSGAEFPLELSVSALNIKSKWHAIGIMRDVTEHKQVAEALHKSEQKFSKIFNSVPALISIATLKEGRFVDVNQSFLQTLGYQRDELIGKTSLEFGLWEDTTDRAAVLQSIENNVPVRNMEVKFKRKSGLTLIGLLSVETIAIENEHYMLSIVRDITERKQLEMKIQESLEYAENIVETVREPLVVLDSDLKILTANHSFYETFKVTPEATIGNFIYDLGNRQWDIPKLRVLFEDILPNNTVFNGYEVEHDFPDIGRKIILLNARQISRENIGSRIILLAMEDITARKQLEAEIQDAREYAENIVETVREPLVVLNSDLKILTANHSFYETFKAIPENTIGNYIYDVGNRQWDIPKLRILVEEILPHDTVINNYEVEHDFLDIGRKIILLNARQIFRENIGSHIILLAMEDITVRKQLEVEIQDAREYAENIVETVREPLVVLNSDLKILTANRSFYETFKVTPEETVGNFLYDLGNRQWDIPKLRVLVEEILPLDTEINGYEVEHDFLDIGRKIIMLNARQIFRENIGSRIILLAMEDITARKQLETEIQDAREYAENIVETVREPLVVLNSDLKILTANHSFYETFKVTPGDTIGNFIYDVGNRQWDIPVLRLLFEKILPHDTVFNGYEVEHDFQEIGHKTILLNARQIFRENIGSHIILLAMEDITARKQLETEIQDAREYAENIVETVRESLVVLNSDLKILTANHSFYETFKVTPEDTIGNFIYDVGNRQWDIPALRLLFEKILPHDTVFNGYEVEHDFQEIGHKTILLNARQIFRENIGSHIILLAMEDITARKQLETEIQDAREYAENIVETVREPLVVLNSDLKILTANHSFYETFKVTPEDTIGNFIYDVGNRQWDIPGLRILVEEILPHDTVINDYEVNHDFQEIGHKTILLNARQIFRENIGSHIILLAMEDITDRKIAEERISEVIRQQQAILNNIPNVAWLKDKEGRYVAVNDPFCNALGLTSQELVGKCDYDIYPPELAGKYDKNFKDVIATGTRTYFEETVVGQGGKINYVEKIKTPIFNDSGAVIGIIGIAHDVTNRKELEVTLRHDSTHDALTGLYNRAFFDEELERFSHSRMFPVSIVMADVNGLKTVNDTLGHDEGDSLIRLAARIIIAAFRAEDIVARIGGDEFAILLPETDTTVAEEAVRRIKSCSEIISGKVSIAFGIASAENKDLLDAAIKLSDERMYQDKSAQKCAGTLL